MKVFVEGSLKTYEDMFKERGHICVATVEEADVIQFVGGADVDPMLYGEDTHPKTSCNLVTDRNSQYLYRYAIIRTVPCIGVCRGAQFLNVMNGGKLYQHVNNHAIYGTHSMFEDWTKREIQVSSTHHQMMIPAEEGQVIAWADESSCRESVGPDGSIVKYKGTDRDVEVVFYEEAKDLCFQPHPEMLTTEHECQEYFFELLERLLGLT